VGVAVIVLVEPDVALGAALGEAAGKYGIEATIATSAESALTAIRDCAPECVVAERMLPDHDASWLAAAVRADPSPLAAVPLFVLTSVFDPQERRRLLRGGVDLVLQTPLAPDELWSQVRALTDMAARIRERSAASSMLRRVTELTAPSTKPGAPFAGDLAKMPASTTLTVIEVDRLSGELELTNARGQALVIDVASGVVLGGRCAGANLEPPLTIVAALAYRTGRFAFRPSEPRPAPPGFLPTTQLLWRALDAPSTARGSKGAPGGAPERSPPDSPRAAASPRPERKTTMMSHAVRQDASKRRQSELVRAVVRVDERKPTKSEDDG
jgi:DNA-binding response OmpR family regulator